jgi:hypothetical protein
MEGKSKEKLNKYHLRVGKSRLSEKMSFLRPACAFEVEILVIKKSRQWAAVPGTAGDCRGFGCFDFNRASGAKKNSFGGI